MYFSNALMSCVLLSGLLFTAVAFAGDPEWAVSDSNVGVGTGTPEAKLHVLGVAQTKLLVENTDNTATGDQLMFQLRNSSASKVRFAITSNGSNTWTFDNTPSLNSFSISKVGTGLNEFLVASNGDGTFRGRSFAAQHINTSTRTVKTGFAEIDTQQVLTQLAALPVSQWRYKVENERVHHIGPVAEDFQEAFNLGDGKTISTVDASGIALAAIKGLKQEKDREITQLTVDTHELEASNRELAASNVELLQRMKEQDERIEQLELMLFNLLRKESSEIQLSSTN